MATKKTTKKNTKKVIPSLVIDVTDCETADDVVLAFAIAKMKKYLTTEELIAVVSDFANIASDLASDMFVNMFGDYNTIHFDGERLINLNLTQYSVDDDEKFECDSKGNVTIKKPNVFKRFWNWITRKK